MHATMLGVELMHKAKRTDRMGDGIIINIASLVGLDPWFLMPIYAASKHAIVAFSRAISVSLFEFLGAVLTDIRLLLPAWILLQPKPSKNRCFVSRSHEDHILKTICRKYDLSGRTDGHGIFQTYPQSKVKCYPECFRLNVEITYWTSFSAEVVGKHVVDMIKTAENGSVWISDGGILEQVSMQTYHLPLCLQWRYDCRNCQLICRQLIHRLSIPCRNKTELPFITYYEFSEVILVLRRCIKCCFNWRECNQNTRKSHHSRVPTVEICWQVDIDIDKEMLD